MRNKNSDYYFLKGGGEMGELIRAKDWSKTSLGDPAGWPQSLRTMVAVMLDNPFGMYIAWGNEYTQLYNDGYRPILGISKHPHALGISTRETFSEIWHIIESMFDGVMKGKAVGFPDLMLPLNRNGFVEDCFFDFAYSPIRKDNGEVGGVLVTVIETTSKKKAENQLKESEERFRTMAEASDILIAVGDETSNAIYFNAAWVNFTGRPLDELLKFGWLDLIHPDDKDRYVNIYLDAYKKRVAFSGEFRVLDKNGDYRWLLAQGPPLFHADGTFAGYISSCMDITDRKNSIQIIEERKRLYETITQNTPDLIYVFDLNYRFVYANDALLKMWGLSWDEAIGKSMIEIGYEPWHAEMHIREIDQVISTKKPVRGEVSFPHAKLGKRMYDYIFVPVINEKDEVEAITGTNRDISDIKNAEMELKKSEAQFRLLADSVPQHIWTSDPQGNLNYYNQSVYDYSGLNKEQFDKDGWIQIVHPDDREENIKQWLNSIATGKDFLLEHRFRKHDGEYRWQLSRAIPQKDENGKIQMWVGTSADINEQKKAQEQFKVLADQAPMWVWLTDKEVNILYTNPEVLNFLGIAHYTEFTGNMWEQKVHAEDIVMVYKTFGEAASLQQSFSFEFRVKNAKNLQYEWFYIKAVPRLENGEFTGFIGTGININEQKTFAKELEEKVLKRTAELKASEEKFYHLFNLSPICKTLSDVETGKIVMVNDAFTILLGRSREETLGRTAAEIGLLDHEAQAYMVNELKTNGKIVNKELYFIKKSGERFIALASAEVITMGEKQFYLCAFNDISEIKKAEQNIKQKNIELEKMNKELQSFAYISSHDLQEPLRKIQTFASRIAEKEESNLSDSAKDMFNRMQNSAQRMQTLIQDLLAYSRTNATEQRIETIDLNEIIAEIQDDFKEELKEKHATIEANQLCEVAVIPFQFRQLMHNLIGNSLKFSRPKKSLHIQITCEIANGEKFEIVNLSPEIKYCHISVSDNGIGFEQQYSEKIFEVFQRLHGKNDYKGTGIGLSIVKKIIDNHHGFITAKGEPNKGATFDICIPTT